MMRDENDADRHVQCGGCGKLFHLAELREYHDRHGVYSGRACSEACSRELPGQGEMWNYDHEAAGERLEEPD